jgi:hypothetical protein
MTDSYKFAANEPELYRNLKDDVSEILEACVAYGYNYYLYGGLVMQIESSHYVLNGVRYFISFTKLNDGRQMFHEASGNGTVWNIERDPDSFKFFMVEMYDNMHHGG